MKQPNRSEDTSSLNDSFSFSNNTDDTEAARYPFYTLTVPCNEKPPYITWQRMHCGVKDKESSHANHGNARKQLAFLSIPRGKILLASTLALTTSLLLIAAGSRRKTK